MFLSQQRIQELISSDESSLIRFDTFESKCLMQASYNLRLGSEAYIVGEDSPITLSEDKVQYITIAPGQFALLMSHEIVNVPKSLLCFITLRNRYKLQGLVNISGFHVDPTYKGRLVFAVNNVGPSDIRLKFMEQTFSIFFSHIDGEVGKGREPGFEQLPLEYVQHLGGSSVTLTRLQKELEEVKTKMLMYAPLGVALLIALILNLLKK